VNDITHVDGLGYSFIDFKVFFSDQVSRRYPYRRRRSLFGLWTLLWFSFIIFLVGSLFLGMFSFVIFLFRQIFRILPLMVAVALILLIFVGLARAKRWIYGPIDEIIKWNRKKRMGMLVAWGVLILAFHGGYICYNLSLQPHHESELVSGQVTRVIDGDTIEVSGIGRIRLVGVNTPERDELGFDEATDFVRAETSSKNVKVDVDDCEPTDDYGRVLAVVYVDSLNVNAELLRLGLADVMYIPPSEFNPYLWSLHSMFQAPGLWVLLTILFVVPSIAVAKTFES